MIDRATIDKIMEASNIVDVVSDFVSLKKSGMNYKGLCPFHDEKTPSFMVSPAKGFCHCFSCGKGGNVVGFIMEHEQMTYPEALRWLAKKYHIEIKERELSDEEQKEENERESMFIVNEYAMKYYQDVLYNHVDGRAIGMQYFRSRGFRDDIIKKFQLGYSLPQNDELTKSAISKGYQPQYLVAAGLCFKRDNGELVDKFSGRVMFPWINISGKVCAFGGRLLDSRTKGVNQKYVNSSDSAIYHKDHELYGLYQAKKAIVKEDCVYMVEGYTDVISMHQCGLENVVANSGTALSVHQIRRLHRFTSNIVLLYDGDSAGIHAALRGTDMLLAEGMNIKVLLLPDNDDPDSFARKHTVNDFKEYINQHQADFISFKTHLLIDGVTDPIKRSEAISSIVKSISVIPNGILRATYIRECANRLGIAERTLISTMNKFIHNGIEEKEKELNREQRGTSTEGFTDETTVSAAYPAGDQESSLTEKVEQLLIQSVIRYGEVIIYNNVEMSDGGFCNLTVAQYVKFDLDRDELMFSNDIYNKILNEAVEQSDKEGFKSETYFMNHHDVNISQIATKLAINHYQLSKNQQATEESNSLCDKVIHLVCDFKMNYIDNKLKDIRIQMSQTGNDMQKTLELMKMYKENQEMRNAIAQQLGSDIIG
jgi:DNA primase